MDVKSHNIYNTDIHQNHINVLQQLLLTHRALPDITTETFTQDTETTESMSKTTCPNELYVICCCYCCCCLESHY